MHIPVDALGAVFSVALAGLAVGGLVIAPWADRLGRKVVLVAAVVIFGVFTLAIITADTVTILLVYRFLTGLGLGAAVPCAISFASELVRARRRAAVAGLFFAGFPVGWGARRAAGQRSHPGHRLAQPLRGGRRRPAPHGCRAGDGAPRVADLLVSRRAPSRRVARSMGRVAPDVSVDPSLLVADACDRTAGAPVRRFFATGRRLGTALLWTASFVAFGVLAAAAWAVAGVFAVLGVACLVGGGAAAALRPVRDAGPPSCSPP